MKRNRVNSLLQVALMALLVLSACSDKRGGEIIPSAKLEAVLYDYHLAQVIVNDLPSNQRYKKDLYFDYVYEKHGVTKAEIDSSLVYYARYPEGLSEIYDNLSKRVELALQRMADEDKPIKVREAVAVVGDSADLWYDINFIEMNISPLRGNRYTFTVPTDTNFKALDRIVWSGEVLFLDDKVDSLHKYLHLNLRVVYMNDSIASADTLLCASGAFSVEVCDSAVVKSIDGTAYLKSDNVNERLLILSPSLMRYRGRDRDEAKLYTAVDTMLMQQQVELMKENKQRKTNKLMMEVGDH